MDQWAGRVDLPGTGAALAMPTLEPPGPVKVSTPLPNPCPKAWKSSVTWLCRSQCWRTTLPSCLIGVYCNVYFMRRPGASMGTRESPANRGEASCHWGQVGLGQRPGECLAHGHALQSWAENWEGRKHPGLCRGNKGELLTHKYVPVDLHRLLTSHSGALYIRSRTWSQCTCTYG